ncbi:hypothetical protein HanIR_Chr02g0072811 [Helianthus annuus]|nr:hypothetical protein HanIR_Chr02g0072811 [Helianthus annuus]
MVNPLTLQQALPPKTTHPHSHHLPPLHQTTWDLRQQGTQDRVNHPSRFTASLE